MQADSRHLHILGILLLSCISFTAGCSSLITYNGQDVEKLANKEEVHESFGAPTTYGDYYEDTIPVGKSRNPKWREWT
jgi:hypothetical protein